jgi:hypothetical protein
VSSRLAKNVSGRQSKSTLNNSMHSPDNQPASILPYTDTKPVGAADFYTAINATFRFMERRFGMEGLRRYWADLGRVYYAPVSTRWKAGGLTGIASYWTAFFAAEPGAEVRVRQEEHEVVVEVTTCPAIKHLRHHQREIVPSFCQHCYFVSREIGEAAGMEVRVCGGNGQCTQRFARAGSFLEEQRLEDILEAS